MFQSFVLPLLIAGGVIALILYLRKNHSGSGGSGGFGSNSKERRK